jgi:hypothetical protein
MKSKIILFLLTITLLQFSCTDEQNLSDQNFEQLAREWFDENTSSFIWENKKARINWSKTCLVTDKTSRQYLVIPFNEYKTFEDSHYIFSRSIVLSYSNGKVADGKIIDLLSESEHFLFTNQNQFLINILNQEFSEPRISIFIYDLNFNQQSLIMNSSSRAKVQPEVKRVRKKFIDNGRTSDYMCTHYYYGSNSSGWEYLGSECYSLEVLGDNGYGSGNDPIWEDYPGGGGGEAPADNNEWSSNVILNAPPPGDIITDVNNYFKCFKLNESAKVTIYVDQPTANNRTTWSGSVISPNVGHTFIGIQQGDIVRFFGYYPTDGVNPYTSPSDESSLIDDSDHPYDVKIEITVNSNQLSQVINLVKNRNPTYNLNSYNCTDFGISVASACGVTLPDSIGNWPGGGGSNPGDLGEDIRSLTSSTTTLVTKTSGTALSNTGTCQ